MLQRLFVIYIVFMLVLTALSWYFEPKLNVYSEDEIAYGREYAAELLATMVAFQTGAEDLGIVSRTRLCDYYLDGQDKFRNLQSAALHMRGEQGEDFVYALSLAEDWCRNAAEAAYHPTNAQAKSLAKQRYQQAQSELTLITVKEYKRKQ